MSDQKVQVTITGDSGSLIKALETASKATENMAHGMENAFGGVASMMEKFMAPLTAMVGLLGGGALFKEAVSETAEFGDSLAKAAQKIGISVEALSGLAHAAKLSDVAFEDLVGGMAKLTKNMQEAVFTPTSKAAAAFKALGIEVETADGHLRSTDEVLGEVAEQFAGMRDGAGKTALAMNLFGKSGAQMIPLLNEGKEGIAELTAEAQRLGVTMSTEQAKAAERYKDDLERVDQMFLGLKMRIGQEVMPTLTRLAEWFTEKAPAMLEGVTGFMRGLGEVIGNTTVQVTALAVVFSYTLYPALLKAVVGIQTLMVQMALARMEGVTFASFFGTMFNPWLVAAAAIAAVAIGLNVWASSYSKAATEKAEADRQMNETSAQTGREFFDLSEKAKGLDDQLQKTTPGTLAHRDALARVNKVVGQMVAAYPEFLSYLHKENGEYEDLGGSIERFTKNKLKLLEMQLEEEKRKATESRNEAVDAMGGGWSGIVGYALVYKGIADNARKEAEAHEASAKAIQQQIDALKGLKSDDGKVEAPGLHPDGKSGKEGADPYLAWEAQMKQEAQDRKERLAAWDKHQQDLNEVFGTGLDKQLHEINVHYDEMYNRERAFGADEATLQAIELRRDQELQKAQTDFEEKQAEERKRIAEEEAKEARRILEETGTAQQGFFDGLQQYIDRQGTIFQQWAQAAQQMLFGIESAFSRSIQGILTGQMSFGQAVKAIWTGIVGSISQAIAQIIAKWLVMKVASSILTKAELAESGTKTAAFLTEGAAGAWAAYGWMPFVGAELAMAQIALMEATVAAASLGALSTKGVAPAGDTGMTINAEGGYYTSPTVGLFGEAGPELVAPAIKFQDFAATLSANILAQERQAQGYVRAAAGYATSASAQPGNGAGWGIPPLHVDLRGAVIAGESAESSRQIGKLVWDHWQDYQRRNA